MLVVRAAACAIPAMVARSDAADTIERALHTAFADLRHGDDISATERARLHTQVGAAWVHGEVTPRGTLALLHALGVHETVETPRADEVLIDLGSGTGALVLAAALPRPKLRAVGVELSAERHASACEARSRLAREGGALADAAARVTLIHGDARANGEGAADAAPVELDGRRAHDGAARERLVRLPPEPVEDRAARLGARRLDVAVAVAVEEVGHPGSFACKCPVLFSLAFGPAA